MSGSLASRSADTALSAAGIWPLMCAVRAASVAKVSKMPYLVSLILNAYQVTVPFSATANSRPALKEWLQLAALTGFGFQHREYPECHAHWHVSCQRKRQRGPFGPRPLTGVTSRPVSCLFPVG
jgi:hypothetical protein